MNNNKVQWQRKDDGVELYVFECDNNGRGRWKPYTQSRLFTPDIKMEGASRGLQTFRKCLSAGYTVLDLKGNEI